MKNPHYDIWVYADTLLPPSTSFLCKRYNFFSAVAGIGYVYYNNQLIC